MTAVTASRPRDARRPAKAGAGAAGKRRSPPRAEDAADLAVARTRLAEIAADPATLVSGEKLRARLDELAGKSR